MEKRRDNLILKEILSAHSNGCVVWWMVSRLNNQTGFGIKSGGSRAAVCFCLQGIHRFMQSVVSTAGPLHCNQSAHSWVWFSPSSQYLSGVNLTVCVCVCAYTRHQDRERESVCLNVKSLTLWKIMDSHLHSVVGGHSGITHIYSLKNDELSLLMFILKSWTW